ncbi:MAG: hypothetical protein NTV34_06010 [Proteobacteria bacterium]|nr:hypothetical protein [Pseudomonadota bacterium]
MLNIVAFLGAIFLLSNMSLARGYGLRNQLLEDLVDGDFQSEVGVDLSVIEGGGKKLGFGASTGLDLVRAELFGRGLDPGVSLRRMDAQNVQRSGIGFLSSGLEISNYEYYVSGFPICQSSIKAIEHPGGETALVGELPRLDRVSLFTTQNWSELEEAQSFAGSSLKGFLGLSSTSTPRFVSYRPCLFNFQGQLEPVWDFVLVLDERQYRVQANNYRVFSAEQRSFDASTATIQAYNPNIVSGTLKDFLVPVDESGKLVNTFFDTAIYTGEASQTSTTGKFLYAQKDIASAESSTFAYANEQLKYLNSVGYTWTGGRPLTVVSNATIKGDANTAFYSPFDGKDGPYIFVGPGDNGGRLQACAILANKCLRSGEVVMKYNDALYASYIQDGHMTGQLISGMLWDIRKSNGMPADLLTKYVLQAIGFLPAKAALKNFIAALLYVDSINGSTYKAVLTAAASSRGLDPVTLGINTDDLKSSASAATEAPVATVEETKKKKPYGCSISGTREIGAEASLWMTLLLFSVPMIPLILLTIRSRSKTVIQWKWN